MAASHHPTTHYPARNLVESAGGIVFSKPTPSSSVDRRRRICILYDERRKEYLLAKGRRDHGENRSACALREVREETGLKTVSLMPVTLECRTTPPPPAANPDAQGASALASDPNTPNIVRVFENTTEPFMCSVRDMSSSRPAKHGGRGGRGGNAMQVKFIWWYVMEADVSGDTSGDTSGDNGNKGGDGDGEDGPAGEPGLMRSWLSVEEALRTLTFEGDREVVREAVRIVERRDVVGAIGTGTKTSTGTDTGGYGTGGSANASGSGKDGIGKGKAGL